MLQRLDMTEGDMERYLKVGEFVCFVCAWAVCVVDFTLTVVACVWGDKLTMLSVDLDRGSVLCVWALQLLERRSIGTRS